MLWSIKPQTNRAHGAETVETHGMGNKTSQSEMDALQTALEGPK